MLEYSNLRVLLVLLMTNTQAVQSCLQGTCVPLQTNSNPTDLITGIKPLVLPISSVPPCEGFDKDFFATEFLNAVLYTRPDSGAKANSNKEVAVCEVLKFFGEKGKCTCCDLSYVVVILADKDGKTVITGQGLRMRDGTILTVYYAVQFDKNYEVLFPCGAKKRVECISHPKKCCKNVLSTYVFTVKLHLKDTCTNGCKNVSHDCCENQENDCCTTDNCFAEPRFQTCTSSAPVSGCLISPTNNCQSITFKSVWSFYLNDPTGLAASLAIPEDPNELGGGRNIGGVFITDDCKILGMVVGKPAAITGTRNAVPLANQVNTACATLVIPIECLYENV